MAKIARATAAGLNALEHDSTLILTEHPKAGDDSILEMILMMSIIGVVALGAIVVTLEWRALVGRLRFKKHP